MTGKACGLIVENSPQRLWKEPVSTAHKGVGNAIAGCGWKVDIFTAATLAQTKKDRALDAPGPETPPEMGLLLQRGADVFEVGAELATDALYRGDDRNRDTGCNQAILDGRGS